MLNVYYYIPYELISFYLNGKRALISIMVNMTEICTGSVLPIGDQRIAVCPLLSLLLYKRVFGHWSLLTNGKLPGFSSITILSKQRREFLPGPLVVVVNSTVCRNQCILNVKSEVRVYKGRSFVTLLVRVYRCNIM